MAEEKLKVFAFQKGESLAGKPCWWLALDDDEDAEECVNAKLITQAQAEMHEEDGYIAGFYHSKEDAIASATKKGWQVTNAE